MMRTFFMWVTLLTINATQAMALTVEPILPDAAQEARAQALFKQLRCVVCDSEALSDSPASVAGDMRAFIRAQIQEGQADEAIVATLVDRYGTFVLMEPPASGHTLWLWLAPFAVLLSGGVLVWQTVGRRV